MLTVPDFLNVEGETAARIRNHDWSGNPLGPPHDWPPALRLALGICLGSQFPTVIYWGPELRVIGNDAWAALPAQRNRHALGRPGAAVWSDIWDTVGPQLGRVLADGRGYATQDQYLVMEHDDGRHESWWSYSMSPIRDADGTVVGVFNQGIETTRVMAAERAHAAEVERLHASEQRLQLALEAGNGIGTWDWDITADRVTTDTRFARLFGVDSDLARQGQPIRIFMAAVHPDDTPALNDAIRQTMATASDFVREFRIHAPDGTIRWIAAQARCSRDGDGRPSRLSGVAIDITEPKTAEATLRATAEELRVATEAQAFILDLSDRQRAADSVEAILTITAESLGDRLATDRVGFFRVDADVLRFGPCWTDGKLPPMQGDVPRGAIVGNVRELYGNGKTVVVRNSSEEPQYRGTEIERMSPAGIAVPLLRDDTWVACLFVSHAAPRDWTAEEIAFVEAVAEISWDAVQRVQAVAGLRESEEKFRAIANSIDQMVWSTRPDGFHDYYNERWYEFTGVPPGSTDGEAWNGMFHPDDQERAWGLWRHCLATGDHYRIEYRLRHHDGSYRWVLGSAMPVRDDRGAITRWFGTCTDIQAIVDAREVLSRSRTELEAEVADRTRQLMTTEEALRQSQKMEAIGQLTGGIAHDFNNMLAVIIGALDLLERRIAQGRTDVARYITAAQDGATRAAALTQRLLAFARQQPLAPVVIDLNPMVVSMRHLLERTIGETIRVETRLNAALDRVRIDVSQLENVLLNLSVNARDAMPRGGMLTIATHDVVIDDARALAYELAPGNYIEITVADTGTGMPPDVAERAFDPFFTTKGVGKGTGLGLSQVFGFVRQSGGHVALETAPGVGTTIRIYLPHYDGVDDVAADDSGPDMMPTGSPVEVLLVVEDEERVRNFTVEALRELGYTVVHAHDGPSALALIDAGQSVSLLFTDMVMPDMNGRELAEAARMRLPGLRTLYASGYTRDMIDGAALEREGIGLMTKPFSVAQLAVRVRDALDR